MSPSFYHVVHLFALAVLIGYGFYAFAGPAPQTKRRIMMITGIAALLMIISGFGLKAKLGYGMEGWIWVKIVCWCGLASLPGLAYRRQEKSGLFIFIALLLILVALVMVYYKPF